MYIHQILYTHYISYFLCYDEIEKKVMLSLFSSPYKTSRVSYGRPYQNKRPLSYKWEEKDF